MLGGEAAPAGWLRELLAAAGDTAVFNHYGPTEATVGVVTVELTAAAVAVGRGADRAAGGQHVGVRAG